MKTKHRPIACSLSLVVLVGLLAAARAPAEPMTVAAGVVEFASRGLWPHPEQIDFVQDGCADTRGSGHQEALIPVDSGWKGQRLILRDKGVEFHPPTTKPPTVLAVFAKKCTLESALRASPFNTEDYAQAGIAIDGGSRAFTVPSDVAYLIILNLSDFNLNQHYQLDLELIAE